MPRRGQPEVRGKSVERDDATQVTAADVQVWTRDVPDTECCDAEREWRIEYGTRRRERATAEERWLIWCTSRLKERRFADPPDFLSFELVRVGPTPLIFWLSGWYGWVRPP